MLIDKWGYEKILCIYTTEVHWTGKNKLHFWKILLPNYSRQNSRLVVLILQTWNTLFFSLLSTLYLMKASNVICIFPPLCKMLSLCHCWSDCCFFVHTYPPCWLWALCLSDAVYVINYRETSVPHISENLLPLALFLLILSLLVYYTFDNFA